MRNLQDPFCKAPHENSLEQFLSSFGLTVTRILDFDPIRRRLLRSGDKLAAFSTLAQVDATLKISSRGVEHRTLFLDNSEAFNTDQNLSPPTLSYTGRDEHQIRPALLRFKQFGAFSHLAVAWILHFDPMR